MAKYSILVNSCDSYSDIWSFFFYVLKKTWNGELPKVYLNTETKQYYDNEIEVCCLNSNKTMAWGERLCRCLNKIEEPYILMMLEDFIFESEINSTLINSCVNYMKNNKDTYAFQMVPAGECSQSGFIPDRIILGGFSERRKNGRFKIIAGPTLWCKDDLLKLTRKNDTPWEWEYFGTYRTRFWQKKCWCWFDRDNPIFDYDYVHGGAIHRGKWVGYKMRELEEKYHYKLDYGEREIVEDWILEEIGTVPPPRIQRLPSIIKNMIKKTTNIIYGVKLMFIR